MNGVHDMGGMHGFGTVEPEPNEPVFHAAWEGARARDAARHGLRRRAGTSTFALRAGEAAAARLSRRSYYQRWALAHGTQVVERGLVDADEIAAGHALRAGKAAQAQAHAGRRRARA